MKVFLLLTFILSFSSYADDIETYSIKKNAVVRNKNFKAKIQDAILKDLISKKSFDGLNFKIVQGKSSEAITFDAPEYLQLKAATVYYHLVKAREYFINNIKSEFVKSHTKTIIRLDLVNKFNKLGHFANENLDPQFNNALTVPAGVGFPDRNIPAWDNEIWFRKAKKIHYKELGLIGGGQNFSAVMKSFRRQTHMTTMQKFLSQWLLGSLVRNGEETISAIMRTGGTSIFAELIHQTSGSITKVLSRKWYHLESALVPEIIYHEYAHMALSDHLKLTQSSSVNEGLADFFAASIANSDQIATKISKYNTFSGKKAKNKLMYRTEFETSDYANTDYVFGLLWELRKIIGKDIAPKFIYDMRTKIDSNSTIKIQLIDGILEQCKESCQKYNTQRYKIYTLFNSKGL